MKIEKFENGDSVCPRHFNARSYESLPGNRLACFAILLNPYYQGCGYKRDTSSLLAVTLYVLSHREEIVVYKAATSNRFVNQDR